MTTMTVADKVEAIEASDLRLAFDGCHKIYLIQSQAEADDAEQYGYGIYDAAMIRTLIASSCFLVYVHAWDIDGNFDVIHPWDIPQGEL
jgi:hypothetical protein